MSSCRSSSVDEVVLTAFTEKGLFSSKEVVLAAFTEKGLLPSKEVVHWRVSHVTGFVIVCEAFVGMEPHVNSFRRVFSG